MIDYSKILNKTVLDMKPSGIRKFFDIAATMDDVISLGVGEPDFQTPWQIRKAGIESLEKGKTKYTSNKGDKIFQVHRVEIPRQTRDDNGSGIFDDCSQEIGHVHAGCTYHLRDERSCSHARYRIDFQEVKSILSTDVIHTHQTCTAEMSVNLL